MDPMFFLHLPGRAEDLHIPAGPVGQTVEGLAVEAPLGQEPLFQVGDVGRGIGIDDGVIGQGGKQHGGPQRKEDQGNRSSLG